MKKLAIVASILAMVTGTAFAESNVTLYGTVDVGVTLTKLKSHAATVTMSSDNWYANKWGIRGTEDLGNGNNIFFNLQAGYNPTNGEARHAGRAFGRESVLGWKNSNYGTLGLGRMGALSSDVGSYTILGGAAYTTFFSPIGSLYGTFILPLRINNGVVYVSPEFAGLQAHLMYSNGTNEDTEKWSKNDHYYGVGLTYHNAGFKSNLIWETFDNKAEKPQKATNLLNFGVEYDFGSFTLYGAYQFAQHSQDLADFISAADVAGLSSLKKGATQNAFSLSASAKVAGGTAMLQGQYAKGKIKDNDAKYNVWSVGAAYLYPLSKRTTAYASVGYGQTGDSLKKYSESGLYGWTTTIGMSHNF